MEIFGFSKIQNICKFTLHFNTLKILYLKHHRADSEGWITNSLCDLCFDEFKGILVPIVHNCMFGLSCKYNICLFQPPSLRGLASHVVFHLTFNVGQFELTRETTYGQFLHVVNSNKFPYQKLFPDSYPTLNCDFIRKRNDRGKKYHINCVIGSERVTVRWSTFHIKHCHSLYEAIGALYFNIDDWWSWFCSKPLFILPGCIC